MTCQQQFSTKLGTAIIYEESLYCWASTNQQKKTTQQWPLCCWRSEQGRPVLLGKTLDKVVQDYILKLGENGCHVNTLVTIAAAKGLAWVIEPTAMKGLQLCLYHGQSLFWRGWTLQKEEVQPKLAYSGCVKKTFFSKALEMLPQMTFLVSWSVLDHG